MDFIIKNKYDCINIRNTCKKIIFDNEFDEPIDLINFLDHIESIKFGYWFNQSIINVEWPKSLKELVFTGEFSQSIDEIPDSIEILKFGYSFNYKINKLPSSLKKLVFGKKFNQSLDNVKIPVLLSTIIFGDDYDKSLDNIKLSSNINKLYLGKNFNTNKLDDLPNVKILKIVNITKNLNNLPFNLESLIINRNHEKFAIKLPFGCVIKYICDSDDKNNLQIKSHNQISNVNELTYMHNAAMELVHNLKSGTLKHINNFNNEKLIKVQQKVMLDFNSGANKIPQNSDGCKIKGFIVSFENLSKLNELDFQIIIGGAIIFNIPFKLMSLLTFNTEEHMIDTNTAFVNFDHNFYIGNEINLSMTKYQETIIKTNKSIDFNIKVILEYFFYEPRDINIEHVIDSNIRQIQHFYSNNVRIDLGLAVQGVFIDKNLDDIHSLTMNMNNTIGSIINYDNSLVKIYGKKINSRLTYISFNENKDYNSFDFTMNKPTGQYENFVVSVNDGEFVNLYFVTNNILRYKNGLAATHLALYLKM